VTSRGHSIDVCINFDVHLVLLAVVFAVAAAHKEKGEKGEDAQYLI